MEVLIAVIIVGVLIVVPTRIVTGKMDRARIRRYVEARGGVLVRIRWAPFGPGWSGNRGQRIYSVVFCDADGNNHEAHCKTSMFTGVYFTGDTIAQYKIVDNSDIKCISCGYSLTGNVSGACPECGTPTPSGCQNNQPGG